MNWHRPPFRRERERAAALVIVLAFVVLITGLVIAFFSNSLLYRQISNSSASAAKVDLFAQGAVDTIVGDLKQEIAAGSTNSTPAAGFTVSVPHAPLCAVPCPVGTPDPAATKNGLVNLLKRSAYDYANGAPLPFYANPAAAAAPTPYDTGTYAPSRRAAGVSSLTPSQNGRSISPARWNKGLLLQKKSAASGTPDTNDTDFTPVGATAASGSTAATWANAPDWVLVARDGSNPTGAFNSSMVTSPSGASTVIGRYAYAIYDEGGLLDANVAGYPLSGNPPYASSNSDPKSSYKSALAFADLTQLPGISALSTGRQMAVINGLVGWRNFASSQPGGSLAAGFTFSTAQLTNFTAAVTGNSSGFLKTSNRTLYQGQSDRMFSTRQELIRLLLNGVATSGGGTAAQTERASLQNALQYLGTFSRGLDQPSYIPGTAASSAVPAPTPQPTAAPFASGGNDAYLLGGDTSINPAFLSARVKAAPFTRNDNSTANVGDPLVAKRFALSRLAWITFKGPICIDDNGTLNPDPDIQLIVTQLQNQGVSLQLLKQGGKTNIQNYFGLKWVTDNDGSSAISDGTQKWRYLHGSSGNASAILRLDQITGRDPDFFELLKAAVTVGSEAKGAGILPGGSKPGAFPSVADPTLTSTFQTSRDTSTDAFIIQLGANIINQAAVDGYPRRILFDDGSSAGGAQEYRGIADLPYIYRTRGGYFKLHEANPAVDLTSFKVTVAGPILDYGLGIFLEQPEIWNPNTWNPATVAMVPATLRPVKFRFTMLSKQLPNYAALGTTTPLAYSRIQDGSFKGPDPSTSREPTPVSLTADNTELDFMIPAGRADLFREPTLLNKPLVPTGSYLQTGPKHLLRTDLVVSPYLSPDPATSGSAKGIYQSAAYTTQSPPIVDNQLYVGVYFGAFPLWFNNAKPAPNNGYVAVNRATFLSQVNFIYRLEYQDPFDSSKWAAYDEKFMPLCFTDRSGALGAEDEEFGSGPAGSVATSYGADSMIAYGNTEASCDPRTARFSTEPLTKSNMTNFFVFPPFVPYNNWIGWVNASQNAVWTARSDEYPGDPSMVAPASTQGFYNYNATSGGNIIAFGWYMQNDPSLPTSGGMCNYNKANGQGGTCTSQYYADADGIVRRAMGAYITPSATLPATPGTTPSGLPTRKGATTYDPILNKWSPSTEGPSRPMILNRPFRNVAELGYVFSGTPWKNIDFFTPESGCAALLDVFCINDSDNSSGLVAGKVNLNTRQEPVLKAILTGAYKDEAATVDAVPGLSPTDSDTLLNDTANGLIARTSSASPTKGPLLNISDLVGKWTYAPTPLSGGGMDGKKSFDGFSKDLGNISVISGDNAMKNSERYRESVIRALSGCGQTRVWNLMVDLVAQTGRYAVNARTSAAFFVEGEQRYWVHLAIDRYTGQVIDKQIELVKE